MATATISCTTVNIGQAPYITLSGITNADNWTLRYEFGSQSDFIAERTTKRTFSDYVWPTYFYEEIPDATIGVGLLILDLYLGNTLVTTVTSLFNVTVNKTINAPTISLPQFTEYNENAAALTGSISKFIRYVSTPLVAVRASAKNGATIDGAGVKVTNGSQSFTGFNGYLPNIESQVTNIRVTDSRGLTTAINYYIPDEDWIPYIKLTCNASGAITDTEGNMTLTCTGNYYNGSFGTTNNELRVYYRYKENSGTFTAWQPMGVTINGNSYEAQETFIDLNYDSTYVFECRATDKAMEVSSADLPAQALPVFHWSKDDFVHETPVDFRAGIRSNGVDSDLIVEQGVTGIWTWRKWQSGFAECWGRIQKSITGSSWSAWGSLYQAEIVQGYDYPFEFTDTPKEQATLHSASGGMLNGGAWTLSASTTGDYYIIHPNSLSNSYSCLLDLYVVGRWK